MSDGAKATVKEPTAKAEKAVARARRSEYASPYTQVIQLHRTIGNQAVQRLIESGILQAKLKIGKPNDLYEQEADHMADQMMRMREPGIRMKPT